MRELGPIDDGLDVVTKNYVDGLIGPGGDQTPVLIPVDTIYTVVAGKQVLYAEPLIVNGELVLDGYLIDVGPGGLGGSSSFIFDGGRAGTNFAVGPTINLGGAN